MQKRLHVMSLPWTQTTSAYLTCAYTQKVVKFCGMMMDQGYEVFLYSGEENEARCTEHISLITEEERVGWFGQNDQSDPFTRIGWEYADPWWQAYNSRAIEAIRERHEPEDFLCLLTSVQSPVADALGGTMLPVEWAVGYEGPGPKWRVFESYAWMHYIYGKFGVGDGHAYDAVIPNFFDPADLPVQHDKEDYLLFLGRVVVRKGPHVAAMIAERTGRRLIIAGPGGHMARDGTPMTVEGVRCGNPGVEYVGPVGVSERAELLGKAAAVIVPTQYIEPFGGVSVEAMMCGTPVVTTDFGAFTETIKRGVGGYRFRTLQEGAEATEMAVQLSPGIVSSYARSRFALEAVGPQFDENFERLAGLWGVGWNA